MAGNKFDTGFAKEVVTNVTITYTGLYNQKIKFEGTLQQAIRHLTNKI